MDVLMGKFECIGGRQSWLTAHGRYNAYELYTDQVNTATYLRQTLYYLHGVFLCTNVDKIRLVSNTSLIH